MPKMDILILIGMSSNMIMGGIKMNDKPKVGCGTYVIIAIAVLLIFSAIGGLGNSSSSSSSSRYSQDYRTNREYRNNVDDVADVYGVSSDYVDQMIQRVVDGANGR